MGWMNDLRTALWTALTPSKDRRTPEATERERKAARRAELEYRNFLSFDGDIQPEIDDSTL